MTESTTIAEDATEITAAPGVRRRPTREEIKDRRRREREGFKFRLFRSDYDARVRLVSLADRAQMAALPANIQDRLTKVMKQQQATQSSEDFAGFLRGSGLTLDMADIFCVAGFIDPPLVMTEDELVYQPDAWVVTDLHPDERVAFFQACNDEGGDAASRLEPFFEGPGEPVLDRSVEPSTEPSVGPVGTTGGGIQPV